MKKKIQTIKTYNQSAAALAKKFNSMEGYLPDIERTFSLIPQKGNPKVVEIGSGSGRDAQGLLKFTNDYLGFDISAEMVKHAKELVPNGKFIVADVDEFDFPKEVDTVFAFARVFAALRQRKSCENSKQSL